MQWGELEKKNQKLTSGGEVGRGGVCLVLKSNTFSI